ncbi:MAG: zinc ABC transporter substrate-binding protein [Clostridia bacterium]|nr:zinc ABC transporter substrate-binding protein [Clostridia bacterium]
MKKRTVSFLLAFLTLCLCSCGAPQQKSDILQITATLFPQYDFAREICGNRAEITLLLPPGMDSHSYEPTPADMLTLSQADLFLYTGDTMEPWAATLADSVNGQITDVSEGVRLLSGEDIHAHVEHSHAAADTDPHIWTNPQNAIIMVENICSAVCGLAPENAEFFRKNADAYIEELTQLDADIDAVVKSGRRKKIVFGGRFAMRYFTERYGLSYDAAYDSCSGEAEPSPSVLTHIIAEMKAEGLPAVYYEELSTPRTAKLIAEETGAKMLLLHSCHTLAPEEAGETYLSLMRKNLENLKIGLN